MKNLFFCLLFCAIAASGYGQRAAASFSFTSGSIDDSSVNSVPLESTFPVVSETGHDGSADGAINLTGNALFLEDPELLGYEGQITVSAWMKMSNASAEWVAIINKWADSAGSYYLGINPANNSVRWNCFVGNIEDPTPLRIGEWVHYAASYNGQEIKLYRNGELVNSTQVNETAGTTLVPFRIGAQSNGDLADAYYEGEIDEVRVYNVALTDMEAADLYNGTLSSEANDLVLYDLTMNNAQLAGENIVLKGKILNNSDQVASDISMEISNGFTGNEESLAGVEIAPHETYSFEIESIFSSVLGEETVMRAEVIVANDAHPANNSRSETVLGYSFFPDQKVVIEEGTGTWCGFCPRGAVALELATEKYPDSFIGIAVHNDDPMTLDYYDSASDFGGYPRCHVNRSQRDVPVNPAAVDGYISEQLNSNVPVAAISHSSSYDANTRNLIVTSTVEPAIPLEGFYAFSLIITEDGVTGTSQDYDQVNYFANNALGAMGGYESLPDPVPASEMVYDHVAREIVGGNYSGNPSSLLTTLEIGEKYSFSHVYKVPDEFNVDNLHLVSLFLDANGGKIINAESTRIAEGSVTAVKEIPDYSKLAIFPNPSNGVTQLELVLNEAVELEVEISTINGDLLSKDKLGIKTDFVSLPLEITDAPPGIYLVRVSMDGYTVTKKLVKQ